MKRFLDYLLKDEMPIWLSILLAFAAGIGAYFLAPVINQEIEYQNNRVSHVSKTVDEMNERIIMVAKQSRRYNDSLFYEKSDIGERRADLLDSITELQWKLIDAATIIDRENGGGTSIKDLQSSLAKLGESVQNSKSPEDQEIVIEAVEESARDAERVLAELYEAAKLSA